MMYWGSDYFKNTLTYDRNAFLFNDVWHNDVHSDKYQASLYRKTDYRNTNI